MDGVKLISGGHSLCAVNVSKREALVYTVDEDMKVRIRVAAMNDPEYAQVLFDEGDGVLVAVMDKRKFVFCVVPGSDVISILVADNVREG